MTKKLFLLIGISLIVCSCSLIRNYPYSESDFLTDRNAALSYLSDSFTHTPEGAELTRLSAKAKKLDASFPRDKHIKSVLKRQRWSSHGGYMFSLNLGDAILSCTNQGNSNITAAERILDHYFSGLSKFGFRNQGSSNYSSNGNIQYAENVWFKEDSDNISIF